MRVKKLVKSIAVAIVFSAGISWLVSSNNPSHTAQTAFVPTRIKPVAVFDQYGIKTNGLAVIDHEIARNETFFQILSGHDVPKEVIHEVAQQSKSVFDVRRLRVGQKLRLYSTDLDIEYVVYQEDPINYVVFDLRDSLHVQSRQRPVKTVVRNLNGTIHSSLFEALNDTEAGSELAGKLAEVLAWQVDFYRIKRGDHFSLIYEEQMVDGIKVGIGDLLAVRFNHQGKDYYAFRYDQGDRASYYDENGNSLKQAFLKAPLKYVRISSGFSKSRFHPVQKRYKPHLGTDYAAPTGTPIYAVGDGTILEAGYQSGNGNYVKIQHNKTYTTGYLHMSRIAKGMKRGARVTQGEIIGFVGSTGLATGPHLCFRFWKNGVQVDSRKEEMPSAEPIGDDQRMAFVTMRDSLLPRLQTNHGRKILAVAGMRTEAF